LVYNFGSKRAKDRSYHTDFKQVGGKMAKVSQYEKEVFVRGMSRTLGSRNLHNVIRSEALKNRIAIAGEEMRGNTVAKICGERMQKMFGDTRGAARGSAFKGCEIVEAHKQLSAKMSGKAGAMLAR
jgi:hypothetical protein